MNKNTNFITKNYFLLTSITILLFSCASKNSPDQKVSEKLVVDALVSGNLSKNGDWEFQFSSSSTDGNAPEFYLSMFSDNRVVLTIDGYSPVSYEGVMGLKRERNIKINLNEKKYDFPDMVCIKNSNNEIFLWPERESSESRTRESGWPMRLNRVLWVRSKMNPHANQ